jgi:type I restriction enzyme S subunit
MNKHGWTYKKFEDCLVKAPKAKQVQTSEYNSGSKYPIISQEDRMISGYCDDSSLLYHIDSPVVIFGDHTRVLKYVDFDFVVGADGVKILIPKDFLKAKFLLYYLRWYQVPSLGYSRHYKLLKEIVLPVPPVEEQERIVAELDLLSSIIDKKKAQLQEYDRLAQSIFYDMFGDPITNEKGWEIKTVGDLSSEMRYGTSRPAREDGEFKYLRMGNLTNEGYLNLKDLKRISIPENEIEKCVVRKGDVLFNRTNSLELIGKTCLFDLDEPMIIAGYLIRVRFKELILPVYFTRLFNLQEIKKRLRSMAKGAVNQANINSKELASINIPVPPLALQQQFAERIEAIEKQKALVRASIAETETLFNSRMDYWFASSQ